METIFRKLDSKKVCYAVIRSVASFGGDQNIEHAVIISELDKEHVKNIGFINSAFRGVLEKDLLDHEYRYFKKNIDRFVLVQSDKSGRIYELKDNSFKKYYKSTVS